MKSDCTDKELLELAAKAAGLGVLRFTETGVFYRHDDYPGGTHWNPLTDDGDALRLAVKLKMAVNIGRKLTVCAKAKGKKTLWAHELIDEDLGLATKTAIVRAAAELGKQIKS